MSQDEIPTLLTKPEAAAILRVVPRTLERWARDGELVPVRIGRTVRYAPEDIRALLDRRSA